MPLTKGAIAIQFAGGLEVTQDEKQVPTTKLLDLQNATFIKQTTLAKRNGYEALSQAIQVATLGGETEYSGARGHAARGTEQLVFTDFRAYSYLPSSDSWADTGEVSSVVVNDIPIARTGTAQWAPDCGTRNGISAVAWEDSRGGVWCSVVEDETKRIIIAPMQLDALGFAPRVMECGENVLILWTRPSANRIYCAVVNPADPTTTPVGAILTDDLLAASPFYDAEPTMGCYDGFSGFTTDRPGIIAWITGDGLRIAYLHPSGVIGAPSNGLPSAATHSLSSFGAIQCLAVASDKTRGGEPAVIYVDTQPHVMFFSTNTLSTVLRGPVTLGPVAGSVWPRVTCEFGESSDSGQVSMLYWAAEIQESRSDLHITVIGRARQDDVDHDSEGSQLRGHQIVSRAFHDGADLVSQDTSNHDGSVYLAIGHAAELFPYVAIIRMSPTNIDASTVNFPIVGRLLPGATPGRITRNVAGVNTNVHHLPSVEARNVASGDTYSRQHRIPLPVHLQLDSEDGKQFSEIGVRLATLDFDHASAYQSAELGRGLYLASACPMHYDGNAWTEAGFHTAPDWGRLTAGGEFDPTSVFVAVAGAGGLTSSATYLYKVWYEAIDAQGELHVGPTSRPILVELGPGEDTVEIDLPTLRYTLKGQVRIGVARSEAGATGTDDSIPLYRVTSTDPAESGAAMNNFVVNSTGANTVAFVDGLSDADLITREPLYTNGGILSNDPAPWSGAAIAVRKDRMFWTDPSDPNVVRFSQSRREETALEQSAALAMSLDPEGGPVTAIGGTDEFVAVYKESAVFAFAGPGPLSDPSAGSPADAFSPPEQVPSDLGCTSPQSIVTIPLGQMFQSAKGIALLSRERQVQLIGSPIETLIEDRVVTSAKLLPARHQVLFLTADDGYALHYDYEHGQWSRFTNHAGIGSVVVGGQYYYLRTDGRVFRETPGVYSDDGSHIRMVIKTAWIKFQQWLQGWQRVHHVMLLGRHVSNHTLRVRYAIDYQTAMSAPIDIDVDADVDGTEYGDGPYGDGDYGGPFPNPGTVYQQSIHLNKRCEAILFEISDVEDTEDFGAAFELSELLLTGGVVRPAFKLGAARSQ